MHGLGRDVETVGNAAWDVAEDLLCSVGGADDEGVVEGETKTNLDQRSIVRASGDTLARLDKTRKSGRDTRRNARCRHAVGRRVDNASGNIFRAAAWNSTGRHNASGGLGSSRLLSVRVRWRNDRRGDGGY